ncbi:MAG: methyltransferase [Gammaproteobacteria bacterium]|nr:methyltransferase [Gammaproteobacteria bacterium]
MTRGDPLSLSPVVRLQQLAALLLAHQPLWRFHPFHCQQLPWAETYPALAELVTRLDESDCERLERDPDQLTALLGPLVDTDCDWLTLLAVAGLEKTVAPSPPAWLANGIGGRKWGQISAFAAAVDNHQQPLLEWCAGKGHLGRLLAWQGKGPVQSLEWQPQLCAQGQQLAVAAEVAQQFVCGDVLAADSDGHLAGVGGVVALHACGDLHGRLLQHAVNQRLPELWLAPCCYHLTAASHYQPFSDYWPSALRLSRDELQLAVQESATGGARIDRLRWRERQFRLAFDALQRQLRGVDAYLAVPSVAKSLISGSFADFARWAAERKGLTLPTVVDDCHWLAEGERRLLLVARLELVRHLFRRPLELLLVLDRLLYLQQAGYQVSLNTFCQRQLSPRNLLLHARPST